MEPSPYDKSCFEVSTKMIRLLRHDPSVLGEEERSSRIQNFGSNVSFRIYVFSAMVNSNMAELLTKKIPKKRFQYCVDPHSANTVLLPSSNSRPLLKETR